MTCEDCGTGNVSVRESECWEVQLVQWVRVYVKVNLIRLIKKEHSGLNKLVDGSHSGLWRVDGPGSDFAKTPLKSPAHKRVSVRPLSNTSSACIDQNEELYAHLLRAYWTVFRAYWTVSHHPFFPTL